MDMERLKGLMSISNEPILVNDVKFNNNGLDVVIDSKISIDELNDKFVDGKYVTPNWYNDLVNKSKERKTALVIENINDIDEVAQAKFIDIIKYKKIGLYKLPENIAIFITYNTSSEYKLNDNIASLVMYM